MEEPFALIDRLRRAASLAARAEEGERNAGDALAQGLGRAQLHEIHAFLQEEAASAAGFAIGCVLVASARPILWLRTEAAAAYDALKADPSRAIPAGDVRARFEAKWAARS